MATSQSVIKYSDSTMERVVDSCNSTFVPRSFHNFMFGFKDGAYYCYCAYVLCISRYSDFLSPMLTNTGIFLRGLKLSGESIS